MARRQKDKQRSTKHTLKTNLGTEVLTADEALVVFCC